MVILPEKGSTEKDRFGDKKQVAFHVLYFAFTIVHESSITYFKNQIILKVLLWKTVYLTS